MPPNRAQPPPRPRQSSLAPVVGTRYIVANRARPPATAGSLARTLDGSPHGDARVTNAQNIARLAGLLYLIVVVTGIFSLAYVPSQLALGEAPTLAVSKITASPALFRWGLASFLVEQVVFLILPLVLFRIFSPFGRIAAWLMVAFAAASVPVSLVALAQRASILDSIATVGPVVGDATTQALVLLSLKQYANGILAASLFWGLWLLPLGYLTLRSCLVPKILGAMLIVGGLGYVVDVFGQIISASYSSTTLAAYALLPAAVGEIGFCMWLVIVGTRSNSPPNHSPKPPPIRGVI